MFEVRFCRDDDEVARAFYGIGQYFGGPPNDDQIERFKRVHGIERMYAAFDGDEIVGGACVFPFDLSVPGGSLSCGGVTLVGVYPTHRRRGVLRAMMTAQLADMHGRGEPIAALWASEETIYGRFGYGLGMWYGGVAIKREWNSFAVPLERRGSTRFVTAEQAVELFPPIWEALRAERPGVYARSEEWWRVRQLRARDEEKASPRRFVVLEIDGEAQAYAIYRTHMEFEAGVSKSKLEVVEAVGATPQATAEIWRFLLDVDWQATVEASLLPPDHPLFLLLASPRRAGYRMGDALWMRLVDVGAALSGRAYRAEGSVVFEVHDAVCPWNEGRWQLAGGVATRTEAPAEIELDVSALGSAFLGAVSFGQLRDGLRLVERVEGAIARADAIFGWRPLPWCPEIF